MRLVKATEKIEKIGLKNFLYGSESKIWTKGEFYLLDAIAEFASGVSWLSQEADLDIDCKSFLTVICLCLCKQRENAGSCFFGRDLINLETGISQV